MELSEYKSGQGIKYTRQLMSRDIVYTGSILEVIEVDGESALTVKIDHQNLIYIVTADEPGKLELMGDL